MRRARLAPALCVGLALWAAACDGNRGGRSEVGEGGVGVEVLQEGSGPEIGLGQTAVVHYTGWFDAGDWKKGDVFDSSFERRQPLRVPQIGQGPVIAGWNQGIAPYGGRPGMRVGEKRLLRIPYSLAYGERGKPPAIPPRANLIFEVELLAIR